MIRERGELERSLGAYFIPGVAVVVEYRTCPDVPLNGGRLMSGRCTPTVMHVWMHESLLLPGNLGRRMCTFVHEVLHYKMRSWNYPWMDWIRPPNAVAELKRFLDDVEELMCECFAVVQVEYSSRLPVNRSIREELLEGLRTAQLTARNLYGPAMMASMAKLRGFPGSNQCLEHLFKNMKDGARAGTEPNWSDWIEGIEAMFFRVMRAGPDRSQPVVGGLR